MKRVFLLISALFALMISLQSHAQNLNQQALLEAYRNGTLSQGEIDELKKSQAGQAANSQDVNRIRRVATSNQTSTAQNIATGLAIADDSTAVVQIAESRSMTRIFGHDLFTNSKLTFEPNLSIATPDNYVLGPGDEVIVDVWGDAQSTANFTISPDGRINIPNVGPVTLSGLSISEATRRVRNSLATIYEGLHDGSVKMKLSLGSIRSIQVNLTGEVGSSGTYTLPSLATLFHALHVAGGVNDLGTMRNIQVYRSGKLFSQVDVYDYILNGNTDKDIALRDGDLITVSAYGKLVQITGEVKRPRFYEMKQNETIADLLRFAGDFTSEANRNIISVTRRQGGEYKSFTVESSKFASFNLEDGDVLSVSGSLDRYENRVEIRGAVYRAGHYAIDENTKTLKQLIARADGLREDAFKARALLYREKADWTTEMKSVDLEGLMSGKVADIELRPNDVFVVSTITGLREDYTVSIYGQVGSPDIYPYAENMTVEDLLVAAGGLLESASTANVTITRRIKDTKSLNVRDELLETFTIDVKDNLVVDGQKGFVLQPFDQVLVRRSPVYVPQSRVTVQGEVAFAGSYPISHRNMRLSEIIEAAGKTTPAAYVQGAYLLREMTEEEQMQNQALQKMISKQAMQGKDSLNLADAEIALVARRYVVGIDLQEAIDNPGSDADLILRDGDVVVVPEYNGTVRVMGSVLYPNSITYKEGKNLKYYAKASGGFDNQARKSKAFVIHMNGMVESGMSAKVLPGSIIIVPARRIKEPVNWSDIVGVISSTASTAAMMISVINLSK